MEDTRSTAGLRDLVLSCLRVGRQNAQSQHSLARRTGYSSRRVREAIADLIFHTEHDGGYYIIENADELVEAILHLYPREIEIRKRRQALEKKGQRAFGGQIQYDRGQVDGVD